jgi:putative PIN family toxin of toxin-antitoxin system
VKVVLDTNVLISGIYFGGIPGKILEAWGARRFQLLVSTEILQEYLNVVERLADQYAGVDYESVIGLIIQNAELVQPSDLPESVSTDPDDDKFLACALAGDSTTIVSGDSDLLNVSGYCGIRVLTPKAFVSEYLDHSD